VATRKIESSAPGSKTGSGAASSAVIEGVAGGVSAGVPGPAPALTQLSFERSIQRLGEIVDSLEEGDQPLEESIALFEEGMALAKSSQDILDRAERRIEELLGVDAQGRAVVRDIEPD
jgi:exodeoxyribonuclease VII small subunit